MNRYFFVLLLTVSTVNLIAQEPEKMFSKAWDLYGKEKYDSSLMLYQTIYKSRDGDQTLIAKSFYNMGDIYMVKKDYKKAKEVFMAILDSDYDEMDSGGKGDGLMSEPYALYKNNSCKNLAEIALEEKKYKDALYYTKLSDYEYPYRHFCGNEYKANDIHIAYTYARCYEGLQKNDKAIAILLPECMYSGLASNDHVVDMACELIKKEYTREQILKELDQAVLNIKSKGIGKYRYDYYTTFFETEIPLTIYTEESRLKRIPELEDLKDIELYKFSFKNSRFYKTLSNL